MRQRAAAAPLPPPPPPPSPPRQAGGRYRRFPASPTPALGRSSPPVRVENRNGDRRSRPLFSLPLPHYASQFRLRYPARRAASPTRDAAGSRARSMVGRVVPAGRTCSRTAPGRLPQAAGGRGTGRARPWRAGGGAGMAPVGRGRRGGDAVPVAQTWLRLPFPPGLQRRGSCGCCRGCQSCTRVCSVSQRCLRAWACCTNDHRTVNSSWGNEG
ncbi:translation initiation factor IF-2-like [Passer montanus]|uniref:translation initiation factor IF-2-like n=1 Tax=Passer montanus TaxID=9160 RepID=UPI001960603A|nr:translation initiation factor IF-2-like [Passer montanus]